MRKITKDEQKRLRRVAAGLDTRLKQIERERDDAYSTRDAFVMALINEGVRVADIALAVGLTRSAVYDIKKRAEAGYDD